MPHEIQAFHAPPSTFAAIPSAIAKNHARTAMQDAYGQYYHSGLYEQRYPCISSHAFSRLIRDLDGCKRILDFGCGSGRYLLPLLEQTEATIIGYDICPIALEKLDQRLAGHPARHRVQLICGAFDHCPDFDGAISMFGVIAHIPTRASRLSTLRSIRQRLQSSRHGGRFVMSVPNGLRRYQRHNLSRRLGIGPHDFQGTPLEPNDVIYTRQTEDHQTIRLYYHVYFPQTLQSDLSEAGFSVRTLEAESFLSESAISRSPRLAAWDRTLHRWLPAGLGYGLYAAAIGNPGARG